MRRQRESRVCEKTEREQSVCKIIKVEDPRGKGYSLPFQEMLCVGGGMMQF